MLNTYLSAARLSHVNVHGLRHSFCTWLLSKGTSVKDVQQVVGHARPSITMDMYWQAIPGSEERVRDAVSGVLPVTPKTAVGDLNYPRITPEKGLRRVV